MIIFPALCLVVDTEEVFEINTPTCYENVTIRLNRSLIVNSVLNLRNVTLIMEPSSDGALQIIVNGELNILESVIKSANPEYGHNITYNPGSRGRIVNSTIEDVGAYSRHQLNPGLLILSSHVNVVGNEFRHCRGTCIWGMASNLTIANNLFEETRQGGIQIGAPDVICHNVTVANNTLIRMGKLGRPPYEICHAGSDEGIGIDFQSSTGRIYGNLIVEGRCSAIEIERGSRVDVYNNVVLDNLDWGMNIHDPGTKVVLHNNTIKNIILRGPIWIYDGAELIRKVIKADFKVSRVNGSMLMVFFDGSDSYSLSAYADIDIIKFIWDFGDNNTTTTDQPTIIHSYKKSGKYEVTLSVVDERGFKGSITRVVEIPLKVTGKPPSKTSPPSSRTKLITPTWPLAIGVLIAITIIVAAYIFAKSQK